LPDPQLCGAVVAAAVGLICAVALGVDVWAARPPEATWALDPAVVAVEFFSRRFRRRLAPRERPRPRQLSSFQQMKVAVVLMAVLLFMVAGGAAVHALHLDMAAWNARSVDILLLAQFTGLIRVARRGRLSAGLTAVPAPPERRRRFAVEQYRRRTQSSPKSSSGSCPTG
jgi:hypothetical protein